MRRKYAERLARLEEQATRIENALARLWEAVDLKAPGGLTAVMSVAKDAAADAKAARQHAECANAGMQALASVAAAKPGPAELAEQVAANTSAVREVRQTLAAVATGPQPVVSMPAPPGSPAGSAGTSRGKKATP